MRHPMSSQGFRPSSASAFTDRAPRWLLVAALVPVAFYLLAEWRLTGGLLGLPLDDSYIFLQFGKSLAAGEGLAYNPGEVVGGTTSPLWTALVSLLFFLPGPVIAWTKLAGIVLHVAMVAATWRLARELSLSRGLATFAAGLAASTYWLVWSALSGMEVSLFTLLTLLGMMLHLRERREPARPPLAFAAFAASALARPDGLLLLALALVDRLLVIERGSEGRAGLRLATPPWGAIGRGLLLAALVVLPTAWVYWSIGGSPLPSTFAVKADAGPRLLPDLRYLHVVAGILIKPQPWMVLLAGAGLVRLAERLGGEEDRGLLPALWVLGLPAAYSLLSPPGASPLVGNFGRYFFSLFPPLIVLGVAGLAPLAARLAHGERRSPARFALIAACCAVLLAPSLVSLARNARFYATNVANLEASDVKLARFLAARVPAEAVVAVEDIGAVKFLAPQSIVDLVGLISPELLAAERAARSAADPQGDRGIAAVLGREKPDLVAVFTNFRPRLFSDPQRFRPLVKLAVPHNITMAGDELVLYATPWCRYQIETVPGAR